MKEVQDEEGKESSKFSFDTEHVSITGSGSDDAPTWSLRKGPGKDFLCGEVPVDAWGVVSIGDCPATLTCKIQIVAADIIVTGVDGIWDKKKNVILRIFALKHLNYKPCLSETIISFTDVAH